MSGVRKKKSFWLGIFVGLVGLSVLMVGFWYLAPGLNPLGRIMKDPARESLREAKGTADPSGPQKNFGAVLFFMAEEGLGLHASPAEVVLREDTSQQAVEVLKQLIIGPQDKGPEPSNWLSGVRVHSLFIDRNGTAFVNLEGWFSSAGTSTFYDLFRAYSVANTLAFSFPGVILRVQLVSMKESFSQIDTHLDLTKPLIPRRDLVVGPAKF